MANKPKDNRGAPVLNVADTADQVAALIAEFKYGEAARLTLHRNRTRPDRAAAVAVMAAFKAADILENVPDDAIERYIVALCANDETREALRAGTPAASPVDPDEYSF